MQEAFSGVTYAQVLGRGFLHLEGYKERYQDGGEQRLVLLLIMKGVGGRLEAFYFAFGENDSYLILDVPDGRVAAAISMAVPASGAARMKTIALLLPEEIDQALKERVHFEPLS
jgi:uncharacterized protein with GYD domain